NDVDLLDAELLHRQHLLGMHDAVARKIAPSAQSRPDLVGRRDDTVAVAAIEWRVPLGERGKALARRDTVGTDGAIAEKAMAALLDRAKYRRKRDDDRSLRMNRPRDLEFVPVRFDIEADTFPLR